MSSENLALFTQKRRFDRFYSLPPFRNSRKCEATCKGQMWRDVGLPEWIFEIDDTDGDDLATLLLQLTAESERTGRKLRHAQDRVAHLQTFSMEIVRQAVKAARRGCALNSEDATPVRGSLVEGALSLR